MAEPKLAWQSKLVLLIVLPAAATDVAFKAQWWAQQSAPVTQWTIGISILLGLITWQVRAATPAAAATGAILTACLMFSTVSFPYEPWHTALIPVLAVSLLAFISTRIGRRKKERLGTAEKHSGRAAAQIAANLGFAALIATEFAQSWFTERDWLTHLRPERSPLLIAALAALAEAAADTVSSEIGQVFGGQPRLLISLRPVEPGTDGAISATGTLAGIGAAIIIAALGVFSLRGDLRMFGLSAVGGVFGLFFDSLLGATAERNNWLNNDAVNFLSTASAAGFALAFIAIAR